jgi:MFS superfamily sulfate permease-like transporter
MIDLGRGDASKGYPLLLAAIFVVGLIQIVLARLRVARLSAIFPASAIEGMLAAIGLLIVAKQLPLLLGVGFEAHDFWPILWEAPARAAEADLHVLGLSLGGIALLFVLTTSQHRLARVLPPVVAVCVAGTLVGALVLHLDRSALITVPDAPLADGVRLPNFAGVWNDAGLWAPFALAVVTLVFIDGTESLATIMAVDKIDPYKRKSDPDRTLLAMGVSNCASSLVGGLTIIPGIVKSTANILGGGRTQWANFYNACFLLVFLLAGSAAINLIPKAMLASILVFVGVKLCRPRVWARVLQVGREQFVVFATTVLVTVTTDLLLGIIAGIAVKYVVVLRWSWVADEARAMGLAGHAAALFRNPVTRVRVEDGVHELVCSRSLCCFNLVHVFRALRHIPPDVKRVVVQLGPGVTLVDHTTASVLLALQDEQAAGDCGPALDVVGLDRLQPLSQHRACVRLATAVLPDPLAQPG